LEIVTSLNITIHEQCDEMFGRFHQV